MARFAAFLIAATALVTGLPTAAAPSIGEVAAKACAAIAERVDEVPGGGPLFLRSYDSARVGGPDADPALGAAFAYDNALAAIALVACGKRAQALRIGEALLAATLHDRLGAAGRLRNAYRAGPQAERPVPPMGWWDGKRNQWLEDPMHVGTATGNVAWAALALLTLGENTGEARFRDGAARLARWAVDKTRDNKGPGGFTGGLHGYDAAPQALAWKSTEHNADLAAVFGWLDRAGVPGGWSSPAREADAFLRAMFLPAEGRFVTGTTPDGRTLNRATSGLDAQLWPLLLREAPSDWRRALAYAERAHGVAGGFDFNDDRDGLWVEGTAQAALVDRLLGRKAEADTLFATLAGQFSPGGYLWATREEKVTTGLALAPDSTTDDFLYYRRPHLGATAWVALAGFGWNPFTGERVP